MTIRLSCYTFVDSFILYVKHFQNYNISIIPNQKTLIEFNFCSFFVLNHNSKRHMHPNAHCSTIYNSQVMEAT